jgi:hypothetical protein
VLRREAGGSDLDIRKRVIAPFAKISPTDNPLTADLSGFVIRLLLFDKYICQSNRLQEFPYLIKAFGYEGVRELLASKAIDVHCEIVGIADVGRVAILEKRRKKGILPLGSFSFTSIRFEVDRKQFIHDCLQTFNNIEGLHKRDAIKLKGDAAARILPESTQVDKDSIQQLNADMMANVPNIRTAVTLELERKLKTKIRPSDVSIQIHPIDEEDFRAETNLVKDFRLTEKEAHEVVEEGLRVIGGLNYRIAEMKAFTALSGFRDSEFQIFEQKLDFISRALSSEAQEQRIKRVFAIKGFQDLDDLINRGQVNLVKLLEVRETRECREFRDWLWSIDSATDEEIDERVNSLRDKLSWFAHGKGGKSVRWLASTGIGLIPVVGTVAGGVTGLLDTFLLEKVLPSPGAISFLNNMYPSIFRENPMITQENFLKTK